MFILFLGQAKKGVSVKKEEECESRVEIYKALVTARVCLGSEFCRRMLRGGFDDKCCYRDAVCSLSEREVLFAELLRCFFNSYESCVSLRGADFGVECTLCTWRNKLRLNGHCSTGTNSQEDASNMFKNPHNKIKTKQQGKYAFSFHVGTN